MVDVKLALDRRGLGSLTIDGVEMNNVRGLTLRARAGEMATLQLEIFPSAMEYEGPADVRIKKWRPLSFREWARRWLKWRRRWITHVLRMLAKRRESTGRQREGS